MAGGGAGRKVLRLGGPVSGRADSTPRRRAGVIPIKDRRVRHALFHAVDIDAIKQNTTRGLAQPSGTRLPCPLTTTPEIEKRLPFANHIPLHRQVIPWPTRDNVTAVHRGDNNVIPYWVTIK